MKDSSGTNKSLFQKKAAVYYSRPLLNFFHPRFPIAIAQRVAVPEIVRREQCIKNRCVHPRQRPTTAAE